MPHDPNAAIAAIAARPDATSAADTAIRIACEWSGFRAGLLSLATRAGMLTGAHGLADQERQHFVSRQRTASLAERETNRARLATLAFPGTRITYVKGASGQFHVRPSQQEGGTPAGTWSTDDALYVLVPGCDGQPVGVLSLDAPADGMAPTPEALADVERLVEAVGPLLEARLLRQRVEALETSQLQAHALHALGTVAIEVVHDLNNLLTVVLLTSQNDDVVQAAERASELCARLLDVGRPPSGVHEVSDLSLVVHEQRPLIDRLLGEEVTLEVSLVDGALPIAAAPGRLAQVLLNLVVNAREAVPVSRVAVRTSRLDDHGTAFAVLEVRDDGCGMPDDVKKRVYEPFFTTRPTGTGVGLATVKRIVDRLRGRIHIDTAPGRGTRIVVDLPLT